LCSNFAVKSFPQSEEKNQLLPKKKKQFPGEKPASKKKANFQRKEGVSGKKKPSFRGSWVNIA
jgi:hypothetical protein